MVGIYVKWLNVRRTTIITIICFHLTKLPIDVECERTIDIYKDKFQKNISEKSSDNFYEINFKYVRNRY